VRRRHVEIQNGALYGLVLGATGAVIASYVSYVGPSSFDTGVSVTLLALGFLAERGVSMALVGAATLVGFPELLRMGGLPAAQAAYLRITLAGAATALAAVLLLLRSPDPRHGR
jgi:hypothetical protein